MHWPPDRQVGAVLCVRHARRQLRGPPHAALALRKSNLARLLSRPVNGIFVAEYEQGDIGQDLFRVACNMGLEGIVSKRLDRAYGAGRCKHWVKVKNSAHPAYSRVRDAIIASRQKAVVVDQ
jgi:ATP-dependent DNA ligase